jgi:deazaflavin-dependent oxidoreductase (nitroreductase family)
LAKQYRLGPMRRFVNAVLRSLLRLGIGPPRTYLLTVPGRTTGRPYTTPVRLIEDASGRWLVAPYGAVAWVRNARAAGRVTLARGRRSETLRVEELGARDAAPILQRYVRDVPITRPYFDARPDDAPERFVAEAPQHPVFRLSR